MLFSRYNCVTPPPLRQGYGGELGITADDRKRWLARIEATQRYWIFLALLWLLIVGGFYVV